MSVKVYYVGGEHSLYPAGRNFDASPTDPSTSYEVTDKDGKVLAVIPRGGVRNADILPDDED